MPANFATFVPGRIRADVFLLQAVDQTGGAVAKQLGRHL